MVKPMRPVRILIDMDEVLTDFVGAALSLWGKDRETVESFWVPGEWDCLPALNRSRAPSEPITTEQFWFEIGRWGDAFWRLLKPTPWIEDVNTLVRRTTDDWHIISSPSRCPTSYDGKVRWLKNYFGHDFDRFALTPHKEIFAGPRVILIDDSDANIQKFREHGGQGIVFPRHNNSLHSLKEHPMKYVRQALTATIATLDDDGGMWRMYIPREMIHGK